MKVKINLVRAAEWCANLVRKLSLRLMVNFVQAEIHDFGGVKLFSCLLVITHESLVPRM